jgi:hypothetical protein
MSEWKKLSVEQRKAIFRTLIEAQDAGQSVDGSRKAEAGRYGVSEETVKRVEKEGATRTGRPCNPSSANGWPSC